MQYELSVILPARNEEFLARTIQDILENKEANTEIIAVLDGQWSNPPIPMHPDVNVIYIPEAIGQRAAQNIGVRLSKAHYVMKADSHCAFDKGFDRKMLEAFKEVGDNVTMVPVMKNLHAFDWKCYDCGWTLYQGARPPKCEKCGGTHKLRRKMLWKPRRGTHSVSYCFDAEPKFRYFSEFAQRPEGQGELTESMSLQGSCFMSTREKYWELKLCDESFGNWGNQGIELACKTWLSGGRVIVNHRTWYAHLFRTRTDFGFPWPASGRDQQKVKSRVRDAIWNKSCPNQIRSVKWLVEKFAPVPGWSDEDIKNLRD